jgi:hypothetical protein
MNKVEKLGSKVLTQLIGGSQFGWPPECGGLLYQPERPTQVADTKQSPDKCEEKSNSK